MENNNFGEGRQQKMPSAVKAPSAQEFNVTETFGTAPAGSDETKPWNNWTEIKPGHDQAMAAMGSLRDHTRNFSSDLGQARQEWQERIRANQEEFDHLSKAAQDECNARKINFEYEKNESVRNVERKRRFEDDINQSCNFFQNNIPKGMQTACKSYRQSVNSAIEAYENALRHKIAVYNDICNIRIADAERTQNFKIDRARQEQLKKDSFSEQDYNKKFAAYVDLYTDDIHKGFNKKNLHDYKQSISSTRFNARNYECPSEVPDYIMLGDICYSIPKTNSDEMTVVHAVEKETEEISENLSGEYIVRLPYAQRLEDGISLLIRTSPEDRDYIQKQLQPLLLKLFMSFPAGKLEATMIDPLDLGANFPDIPKLGEGINSARVIDTKIWSREKDIETAISTLRQRLENITQSYGEDKSSRLKKEVIRALFIADFPEGFNNNSLKDLHAIVRNSKNLGVCIVICSNDSKLEAFKEDSLDLVEEIKQNVVDIRTVNKRLMLATEEGAGLFIELDDMNDALENKDSIIPLISDKIEHMQLRVEHFEDMFENDIYDSNNWFTGTFNECAIPIGIKGADTVVKMVMGRGGGSTEHHALIAGQTGAGKSTLLHTLIMSTLISYSPDDVQLYILDFKEGVEFSEYTRYHLPSLRVVAINSEREFGLNVLKELCEELETRAKYFNRYGVSDHNAYVELADVPKVPKLLLIFDEVQELFRSGDESDNISQECLSCLNRLFMQGRAMGIHVILACQDFNNCQGLQSYFSQIAIRIAVKGSEEGAASILSSDNKGVRTLQNQPVGSAIYNSKGGVETANNFFQVSFIKQDERTELLTKLDEYFTDPGVAPLYEDKQTKVLLTNAEDDINNCYNRLILQGRDSIEHLGKTEDGYGLTLGLGYQKESIFIPELRRKKGENLLIVSKDEKIALSLFEFSAMSILYEELHTNADKNDKLIYVLNLSSLSLSNDECDFSYFESQFPKQMTSVGMGETADLIKTLYETVLDRSDGTRSDSERIFLMIFGLERARALRPDSLYDDDGEKTPNEMLRVIIEKGPAYGINTIVWSENISGTRRMLDNRCINMFNKRIAYGLDEEAMSELVFEFESKSLRGKTAVYFDFVNDIKNTHFRPYDVVFREWIEDYSAVYEEIVSEEA